MLAPPITTAAMAYSSSFAPASDEAEEKFAVTIRPAMLARKPEIPYTMTRWRSTRIPDRLVPVSLDPMA